MSTKLNIVGYGVCGPGEADKYLRQTLEEFKRICDQTIILLNNVGDKEREMVAEYGFLTVEDNREWGKNQWLIKEEFYNNHVAKLNPDMCVCLDMDEVFHKKLTREKLAELYNSQFSAFAVHIVNLWDKGYKKELSFWNIRIWKPGKEENKWPRKNLHCGLAPEWTWHYHYFAPYLLKHYGLQEKDVRMKKVERYKKYDPNAKWLSLDENYYKTLASDSPVPDFDEDAVQHEVEEFVKNTNQKYIERKMKQEEEVAYIELKDSHTIVPVPKNKLDDYIRQGHKYVDDHNNIMEELNEILDEPVEEPVEITIDHSDKTEDDMTVEIEDENPKQKKRGWLTK